MLTVLLFFAIGGTPSPYVICHCEEYPKGTCFAARSDAAIRTPCLRIRIPMPVTLVTGSE